MHRPSTRRLTGFSFFYGLLYLFLPLQAFGQQLITQPWKLENPQPVANSIYAIAQGNGLIVAVGWKMILTSSDDGETFTPIRLGTYHFQDVGWNGLRFIACTEGGQIFSSEDGFTWELRLDEPTANFRSLAHNDDRTVVVGAGMTATSTDGITWTTLGNLREFLELFWNGTTFVSYDKSRRRLDSLNGLTWTQELVFDGPFDSFCFGGSRYVALGDSNNVYTSNQGSSWFPISNPPIIAAHSLRFANGYFFLLGSRGVYRSAGGQFWTEVFREPLVINNLDVIWTGTRYLMVGLGNMMYESPDGENWSLKNGYLEIAARSIAWDGKHFLLQSGRNKIWQSPNGQNWQEVTLPIPSAQAPTWSGMGAGPTGTFAFWWADFLVFSPDGQQWSIANHPPQLRLGSIHWFEDAWFASTNDRHIFRSIDGVNWDDLGPIIGAGGRSANLAYQNGIMVAVSGTELVHGTIASTTDFVNWHHQTFLQAGHFNTVAWVGDRFLAGSNSMGVFQSVDGITWQPLPLPLEGPISAIKYHEQGILILANNGGFIFSKTADGPWRDLGSDLLVGGYDFAWNDNTIVAGNFANNIFWTQYDLCFSGEDLLSQLAQWLANRDLLQLVTTVNEACPKQD